jgi:hypothetical protein
MVNVPERFRPHINVDYPEGNSPIFEEWFYETELIDELATELGYRPHFRDKEYLPVFWTSYWVNHRYGKDMKAKRDLQNFVNSLDKSKQYFTIVQYDDGPVIKLPPNVKVFAMSGPRIDYPLPLICQPHKYQFNEERDLFCNFIGRMTYPVRKELMKILQGKTGYLTSSNPIPTEDFCRTLAKSVFTLCPRGYGQTSFRICEALQYGSIPVYISDDPIWPHNDDFSEYGVFVHSNIVNEVGEILRSIPGDEIKRKQANGRKIYNEKFSFQGCKELILSNI